MDFCEYLHANGIEPSAEWDGKIDIKRLRTILDTAKSQIVGVQKTVDTMIEEQAEKCKLAGATILLTLII